MEEMIEEKKNPFRFQFELNWIQIHGLQIIFL